MNVSRRSVSAIITALAVLVLAAALPSAVRDTFENGRVYLFSRQFLDELPQRFTGPGRFRFILQPLVAVLLGWRGGLSDAHSGRPAYLYGVLMGKDRRELLRSGIATIRDLVCMGIVLDSVAQLLIYRQVHPGAALVIGPVFICIPYALSRALTNRVVLLLQSGPAGKNEER